MVISGTNQHVAEAVGRGDHLGEKHHDAGDHEANAAAGQDRGHGGRQHHLEQDLAARRARGQRRPDQLLFDHRGAIIGRQQDRKQRIGRDQQDLGFMVEAKQQQQRGIQCDLGQRRQHPHDRPHHGVDSRTGRRCQTNPHAKNDRDREPDEQPKQRGRDLLLKRSRGELLRQAQKYHARRRQQRHRCVTERNNRLPKRNRQRDRHDPQQDVRRDDA